MEGEGAPRLSYSGDRGTDLGPSLQGPEPELSLLVPLEDLRVQTENLFPTFRKQQNAPPPAPSPANYIPSQPFEKANSHSSPGRSGLNFVAAEGS